VVVAENVIIGKNVRIGVGEDKKNEYDPKVYSGLITVVGMDSVIPDDVTIGKNCVIGVDVDPNDFESRTLESGGYIFHRR